jgi:hypothetical protein
MNGSRRNDGVNNQEEFDMTYSPLAIVQVGDAPDLLHPSIDENLQIIRDGNDGPFDQPFQVSKVSIRRKMGNNWVTETQTKDISFQLWITGTRVILYCRNFDKGGGWRGWGLGGLAVAVTANAISKGMAANRRRGRALVGNIRYPWITKVGFSPRSGIGSRETIDIQYIDGTDSTKPECSLTIHLDNRTDANRVARFIADKVIAYRYADKGELTPELFAKFETLRTSGLREAPERGYVNFYLIPTSWNVPHGLDNAPDDVPPFPAPGPASIAHCTACGSEFLGARFCTDCGAEFVDSA